MAAQVVGLLGRVPVSAGVAVAALVWVAGVLAHGHGVGAAIAPVAESGRSGATAPAVTAVRLAAQTGPLGTPTEFSGDDGGDGGGCGAGGSGCGGGGLSWSANPSSGRSDSSGSSMLQIPVHAPGRHADPGTGGAAANDRAQAGPVGGRSLLAGVLSQLAQAMPALGDLINHHTSPTSTAAADLSQAGTPGIGLAGGRTPHAPDTDAAGAAAAGNGSGSVQDALAQAGVFAIGRASGTAGTVGMTPPGASGVGRLSADDPTDQLGTGTGTGSDSPWADPVTTSGRGSGRPSRADPTGGGADGGGGAAPTSSGTDQDWSTGAARNQSLTDTADPGAGSRRITDRLDSLTGPRGPDPTHTTPSSSTADPSDAEPSTAPVSGGRAGMAVPTSDGATLGITPTDTPSGHASVTPDEANNRYLINAQDPQAPNAYHFHLSMPQGSSAQPNRDGGVDVVNPAGRTTQTIAAPWARDATGAPVATHFTVAGNTLTQHIDPSPDSVYPILADPAAKGGGSSGGSSGGKSGGGKSSGSKSASGSSSSGKSDGGKSSSGKSDSGSSASGSSSKSGGKSSSAKDAASSGSGGSSAASGSTGGHSAAAAHSGSGGSASSPSGSGSGSPSSAGTPGHSAGNAARSGSGGTTSTPPGTTPSGGATSAGQNVPTGSGQSATVPTSSTASGSGGRTNARTADLSQTTPNSAQTGQSAPAGRVVPVSDNGSAANPAPPAQPPAGAPAVAGQPAAGRTDTPPAGQAPTNPGRPKVVIDAHGDNFVCQACSNNHIDLGPAPAARPSGRSQSYRGDNQDIQVLNPGRTTTVHGHGNQISGGDGDFTVHATGGDNHARLGNGEHTNVTANGGDTNTVTLGNGRSARAETGGSHSAATVGDGEQATAITDAGHDNTATAGNGRSARAFAGTGANNRAQVGNGDDTQAVTGAGHGNLAQAGDGDHAQAWAGKGDENRAFVGTGAHGRAVTGAGNDTAALAQGGTAIAGGPGNHKSAITRADEGGVAQVGPGDNNTATAGPGNHSFTRTGPGDNNATHTGPGIGNLTQIGSGAAHTANGQPVGPQSYHPFTPQPEINAPSHRVYGPQAPTQPGSPPPPGKFDTLYRSAIGGALSGVKGLQTRSDAAQKQADKLGDNAQRMRELADDPTLTPEGRAAARRAAQESAAGAARTQAEADKTLKPIAKIPEPIRTTIAKNPGQLIEDADGPIARVAKPILKGMPYVGTIATAIWAGVDIVKGHPAGETLSKSGGAIAGGLAAGQAGGEVGGVVGSFFGPGPGTLIGGAIGAVGGGAVGGISGSGLADDIYHWLHGDLHHKHDK